MQKEELVTLLDDKFDTLLSWLEPRPEEDFSVQHMKGKWSNGEHLEHLRKSTRAVNKGMKIPKLLLRYKFGKMNRTERTYQQIVEKYNTKLKETGVKAPKQYSAENLTNADRARIMSWFREEKKTMQSIIRKTSEQNLSKYVLPHPLLGKMSFREFVCFTAYHTEHHFKLMQKYNGE